MQRSPLFSVILPTHSRPEMLRRAIASVRAQTLTDFELIIVDDASPEPVRLPEMNDARVQLIRSAENRGAAHARNLGLHRARGQFVSFLDDDDEYAPNFLAATHERLCGTDSSVGASWCNVRFIDDAVAREVGSRTFPSQYPDENALLADFLTIGVGFGVTIKANCLATVGGFDITLAVTEDDDLLFRIVASGFTPLVVPQTHVLVHSHLAPRLTGEHMNQRRIAEARRLLRVYASFLRDRPAIRQQVVNNIEFLEAHTATTAPPAGAQAPVL